MRKNLLYLLAASVLVLAGCASTTTIYDPAAGNTGIRNTHTVSAEELKIFANDAVYDAMNSPRFKDFLAKYKVEMNDANARPVLKLTQAINDTDDPDLNLGQMTDLLNEALLNSNIVDVTMAEGADRSASIGGSRDLAYDANFDQSTVAKTGTLKAARLVMRPKVISNVTREGSTRNVIRTFKVEMADIATGMVIWSFTRQQGFIKTRAAVGM
jgi:uncharacterized protein (TIGR02722 family)